MIVLVFGIDPDSGAIDTHLGGGFGNDLVLAREGELSQFLF